MNNVDDNMAVGECARVAMRCHSFINNGGRNHPSNKVVKPYWREPCPTTRFGDFITSQYGLLRQLLNFFTYKDLIESASVARGWLRAAEMEKACRSVTGGSSWAGFVTTAPINAFHQWADSIYYPTLFCMWFSNEPLRNFYLKNGPVFDSGPRGFASLLTIPKMQGVEVHHFRIKMMHARKIMTVDHIDQPDWLINRIKGPDKPIRCLILFINECLTIEPGVMFQALQNRQKEKMVIGGAFITPYESPTIKKRHFAVTGIAFYGDNVEASSLVLTDDHKSPEVVEERMVQFARGSMKGKVNLAFMFTCSGRGQACNRKTHDFVDSRAFARHFPTTPLHGVVGLGEIGIDHFPMKNGIVQSKISDDDWLYTYVDLQYSSVFVHLAFGLSSYEEHLLPPHIVADLAVAKALRILEERNRDTTCELGPSDEKVLEPEAGPSGAPQAVHASVDHSLKDQLDIVADTLGVLEDSLSDATSDLGPSPKKVFKPEAGPSRDLLVKPANAPEPFVAEAKVLEMEAEPKIASECEPEPGTAMKSNVSGDL